MTTRRQTLFGGAALTTASLWPVAGRTTPRPIEDAETAVTVFAGRAAKGPLTPTTVNYSTSFERQFGASSAAFPMSQAVWDFFANGGKKAIILRLFEGGDMPGDGCARLTVSGIPLVATSPGAWGNRITATVGNLWTDPKGVERFTLKLYVRNGRVITQSESYVNVSFKDDDYSRIDKQLKYSELMTWEGEWPAASAPLQAKVSKASAKGGNDGAALTTDSYHGLEALPAFNLMCLPEAPPVDTAPSIWQAAHDLCVRRRALLIVDPPATWTTAAQALAGLTASGLNGSSHAALYFPRLINGPVNKAPRSTAPCGAIAGVFARTDAATGVWKAPAGMAATIAGGYRLSVPLSDAEGNLLNTANINAMRTFNGTLPVVFGARTLSTDPAYRYVPVRRLAQFIENSLRAGLEWTPGEGNSEAARAQFRLLANAFMQRLFQRGAFAGTTPQQAYFVRCDNTTNLSSDIWKGRMVAEIGFAPLKPAEFVILRLTFQLP